MDEIGTYGQFGQAVYDHEERNWLFERGVNVSWTLEPFGEPQVVVQASAARPALKKEGKEGPSRRRENQVKALTQVYPELQPASGILPGLARISEAVEESSSRHDPVHGNRLAFGIIPDELTRRKAEVVAFATGPTGSDLRIAEVKRQARGWEDSRKVHLQVPTIFGEETTWTGSGVPIRSIVVANPLEKGDAYFAVRLISQTWIFQPVLRKHPQPNGSRLLANPKLRLDVRQYGGPPLSDVTFNPWYSRQFANLDEDGTWRVCEMKGKESLQVTQVCFKQAEDRKSAEGDLQDAWGRLTWVCGPSILAICSRRKVAIFDTAKRAPTELHQLDVGLRDGLGWILDVALIQSAPNFLATLTSTHLFVHYIQVDDDRNVDARQAAEIRHFWSEEDISLRMHCYSEGHETMILIRSDVDPTVLLFRLRLSDRNDVTIDDPFLLRTHSSDIVFDLSNVSALHVHKASLKGDFNGSTNGALTHRENEEPHCFQLTALYSDLSVCQTLYVDPTIGDGLSKRGVPTWERQLKKRADKFVEDDFIVNDEDEAEEIIRSEPISNHIKRLRADIVMDSGPRTIDYVFTARHLNESDVADVTGVDEVLDEARSLLKSTAWEDILPLRTLRESADEEITLQDIDRASAQLDHLLLNDAVEPKKVEDDELDGVDQTSRLSLHSIDLPPNLNLPPFGASGRLKTMSEGICQTWIQLPPDRISDITRLSMRQLAHRMAAEISLASLVIRPQVSTAEPPAGNQSQTQSQPNIWDLPVRPGASPSSRATPSLYLEASSQPRSSARSTPFESVPTSPRSSSSRASRTTNSALTRLSHYTTIAPEQAQPGLSRRMNRILDHWSPGADPSTYDWMAARKHFTQLSRREDQEAEGAEMTERERARLQRRTERYVRRQQREAEEAQRQQVLSSQAPAIASGSQPLGLPRASSQLVPAGRMAEGQSQGRSQGLRQVAASQVLPGRHGGRPVKKKRKSGF